MTQWIAGITRGHNAGVCLLKDGEIVFAVDCNEIINFLSPLCLVIHTATNLKHGAVKHKNFINYNMKHRNNSDEFN